ncbi:DUF6794 domain-containing protein [Sphingobacterium sp. FBM7-1]|uniref:DUF6794 domain-containing protein n=1 Tax=Sphingobacterium sp. FBM7-1 TaxID=2886688 RepID=UPI001D0FB81F|nr:DUF6794 domain-containing protein [Sphingobacterium sp. FBM7-1]MCC2599310.1 hypothetical protein [Sphingobacterium sp. FBM7-1]
MKTIILLFLLFPLVNVHAANIFNLNQTTSLDTTESQYIPKNMKDCLRQLDRLLSDSVKNEIRSLPESAFLNGTHFGLGMWIRNNWGLWDNDSRLHKYFVRCRGQLYEPDFMSGDILSFYYDHLAGDKKIKSKIRKFEKGKKWW